MHRKKIEKGPPSYFCIKFILSLLFTFVKVGDLCLQSATLFTTYGHYLPLYVRIDPHNPAVFEAPKNQYTDIARKKGPFSQHGIWSDQKWASLTLKGLFAVRVPP